MNIVGGLALYFVIWWITLFAVLPFGVKPQHETGEVTEGTEPGAPSRPLLVRKLIWTTVIAALVFAAFQAIRAAGFTVNDFPFGPR